MSKLKKPHHANNTQQKIKERFATDELPAEKRKPLFSFYHLDRNYCISCCTQKEKAALSEKLRELSNLTWLELRQAPRHGLGYEKIARNAVQGRIPQHIKEDVTFLAFRFYGKAPMVGYREEATFHVIWLDRAFELYNHG